MLQYHTFAVCLVLLTACTYDSREVQAKAAASATALADDALRAGVEIKVSGNIDSVLRAHSRSPEYASAMSAHFSMMKRLHDVSAGHLVRYTGYQLQHSRVRFCRSSEGLTFVLVVRVRLDVEAIPPNSGVPPYSAGEEEHVFRFSNTRDALKMVDHHETTLAEMHERARRHPC